MTDKTTKHATIAAALAAAQAAMGRAAKSANNLHFKSKYADLASVMDACMPALTLNGIAVTQPVKREDGEIVLYTILHHADSDQTLDDGGLPLIVNKRDMQGLGSALTYARRYGLMAMAGIAADDDDGNAAAAAAPKEQAKPPAKISADQWKAINDLIERTASDEAKLCLYWKVAELHDLTAQQADQTVAMLTKKLGAE
jgi:hypothetical protein